jgi:hypothetical protein
MKTNMIIIKKTTVCAVVCALAGAIWLPISARADDTMKPMKGGEHLMMLHNIKTPAEAQELKPGDAVEMVCTKCKSVMVENVTTEKGHIKTMTVGEKHLCPGCNSTMTVIGVGKNARDEVKHACEKCGSDSAFCCSMKSGGGEQTKGMEEKK